MDSLLPHNSTEFERQLEAVLQLQTQALDAAIIRQIHDPETCPVAFLPWLAFSENVDAWDDNWSESIKRSVISNAATAHKRKGTRGGLVDALASLSVVPLITEWWEQDPPGVPGTMQLLIDASNVENIDAIYKDISRVVDANKRFSIHYTIALQPTAEPIHCFDWCKNLNKITARSCFFGVFNG